MPRDKPLTGINLDISKWDEPFLNKYPLEFKHRLRESIKTPQMCIGL